MPETLCPDSPTTDPATVATIDWERELDTHGAWLKTVIAARVGEAQAVSDVFQEVALAAVRQKAPIQDPTKTAPWLYRLAVLQSLLFRRKAGRRRNFQERYQDVVSTTGGGVVHETPLDWLLLEERRNLVQAAMNELPDEARELLALKYTHDWSYKEMADHLGMSVSAVQARLHRARAQIRSKLAAKIGSGTAAKGKTQSVS